MAKELPYFKFEPNQWDNGNIQMLTREDKGLFMDLCSMYWSRLGDVPFKLAVQKLCGGNAVAFDSLISEDIIQVIDDAICIHFLNEQLSEFEDLASKNRENALKGWEKRRKESGRNAVASNSQSQNDAIREEERREEKKKEEDNIDDKPKKFNFTSALLAAGADKQLATDWVSVRKAGKAANTQTAFNAFMKQVDKSNATINEILEVCCERSWKGFKADWLDNIRPTTSGINYNDYL